MTLPRRNSRRITVGGKTYRWLASGNSEGINVFVELEEAPGQLLCETFLYEHNQTGGHSPVASGAVAELIETAIASGWEPEGAGPNFRLDRN